MRNTRYIAIDECSTCPNYNNETDMCDLEDKSLEQEKNIPEWCPLPTLQDL